VTLIQVRHDSHSVLRQAITSTAAFDTAAPGSDHGRRKGQTGAIEKLKRPRSVIEMNSGYLEK
jgi:hypothetical protein